jgi:hypothetical protein
VISLPCGCRVVHCFSIKLTSFLVYCTATCFVFPSFELRFQDKKEFCEHTSG